MRNHYKDMLRDKFAVVNGYTGKPQRDWLKLYPPNYRTGFWQGEWKFHLSVHEKDAQKAWNIVVDTLTADGESMHVAKVAKPQGLKTLNDPAKRDYYTGKSLTIYTSAETDPQHYKDLMQDIEGRLRAAGVRPGLEVEADRKVPGSRYISYVNDLGNDSFFRESYNPRARPDPFHDFSIDESAMPQAPAARRGGLMRFLGLSA